MDTPTTAPHTAGPHSTAPDNIAPTSRPDATRVAVVTGASRGLGAALARGLAGAGWHLVLDARTAADLAAVVDDLAATTTVRGLVGDVTDPDHRRDLVAAAAALGPVGLVVNNAGGLGPSPLPHVLDVDPDDLAALLAVNTVAPLALVQDLSEHLAAGATIANLTSDAGTEAWEGWGVYGATKAALDHLTAVLAVERPDLHVHAVDPGDLRTDMHQAAFPGEDIGDRPRPETVVPAFLALVDARVPSGRHALGDLDLSAVDAAHEEVPA